MVKNLYDSCINEDAINAKSTEPILPLLKEIRTIYSIDKNGNKPSKKQFTKAMVASFQYGIAPFFQFNIDADPKRPAINSIQLVQSGLTLPSKEYYKNENVVDTLLETVEETIQLIVDSTNSNNNDNNKIFGEQEHDVKKIAKSIVDFEKELASLSDDLNDVLDRTKTYNPLTLSELTKLSPIIDWDLLLTDLQPPSTPHQDTVIVNSPTYIGNITVSLIEKATPETILGYLLWRVVDGYVVALGEDIRKPSQKLNAVLQGTNAKVTQPRWETCLKQVDESVGFLAGRLFVQAKFSDQEKKRADNFFQSLKESFVDRLQELPWLDDSTRKKAIEKVNKLVLKIGYPTGTPDINSPISLSEYYSGLELNGKDYFGNYLASQRFNTKKAWEGVGKETDKSKWIMNPQDVNAYCNPSFNEIVVPAGILQYPLFGPNYPDYLQYGGIGMVIGHELTHGFDNAGRHYDGEGRLAEWWTDITANAFDERAQCFIDQYSNYTIDTNYGEKLHINGKQTLGENIADNGGLSEAYIAWKRQYDSDKQSKKYNNPLLPGLQHLTPNQLFFINFGRIWCNNMTKEAETQWVLADEHSPPRWRVNGVIQNSKHFAEAFQCPIGSAMNKKNKCELW
ncbi:hypothetical protein BJ944DRAFT_187061 [Cunninghamella echinulata]|nr:hypothetical protein BJ944DRAFT_187061 [Cunninghamella echinulata]